MELQLSSFSFLILPFFLFIFMLFNILKRSKAKNLSLPPGPWKLPIIGSLHHLSGSLPQHRLRDLAKKYGPVMHLQLGEICYIVISSAEGAEDVMKTQDIKFVDRPPYLLFGDIIFYNRTNIGGARYGEYYRQVRKILMVELLSAKCVQSFRSIREEEVLNLNKSISSKAGSLIDVSKILFSFTYRFTTRAAFGQLREDGESFIQINEGITELLGTGNIVDLFPSIKFLPYVTGMRSKIDELHHQADTILESIIREARARRAAAKSSAHHETNDAHNFVDVLLDLQEYGNLKIPLTTDNIKALILDTFLGGTDTSSTVMEWAMAEMLKNPRVMEKAQAEVRKVFGEKGRVDESGLDQLSYLKMVVKETMRVHPPFPLLIPRSCREESEISGYKIPVNSTVLINSWAIALDSNYWDDAERFNPERFLGSTIDYKGHNFEFTPFGAGRRMCPGMSFGVANVELPLASFLYHFDWALPDGMKPECLDMLECSGNVARRKNHLHVTATVRHPLPAGLKGN